jgi:hypothetical protein
VSVKSDDDGMLPPADMHPLAVADYVFASMLSSYGRQAVSLRLKAEQLGGGHEADGCLRQAAELDALIERKRANALEEIGIK